MAKRNNSALGCLILLLIAVGSVMSLGQKNPFRGVAVGVGLALLGVIVIYALRPRRCDICGNVLQRKSYPWTIEGVKKRVCPHCNQSLARKRSKTAMRQFR